MIPIIKYHNERKLKKVSDESLSGRAKKKFKAK
jgi:hypothetical protein